MMNLQDIKDKKSSFWILHISGWLSLSLIYLVLYYRGYINDPQALLAIFLTYIIGFFVSLLLRYFYQKIHYKNQQILRLSIYVAIGSVIGAVIWFWIDLLLSIPLHDMAWAKSYLTLQRVLSETWWHSFILGMWSVLYFVIKLWIEWNLQKDLTDKANALAQSAQLQMLRYQLNPHFLFNALNSIRALIEEDKIKAKSMITELSEFLRYSLISKNYKNVPLKEELKAIEHYFKIEKKRFEEKLQVVFNVEQKAEEFPVLSFLIHPLVENAVKFGMKTSKLPLQINLNSKMENESLIIEVHNSGKWVNPEMESKNGTGTGLKNIRERLENAFPERHSFEIIKNDNKVSVIIKINPTIKI
jgi:two-component system, LytTR family, sensor kinase